MKEFFDNIKAKLSSISTKDVVIFVVGFIIGAII